MSTQRTQTRLNSLTISKLADDELSDELECISECIATCNITSDAIENAPAGFTTEWRTAARSILAWKHQLMKSRDKIRSELLRRLSK